MTIKNITLLLGACVVSSHSIQGADGGLSEWERAADPKTRHTLRSAPVPFSPSSSGASAAAPPASSLQVASRSPLSLRASDAARGVVSGRGPQSLVDLPDTANSGKEEVDESNSRDAFSLTPENYPLNFRYITLESGYKKGPKDYDDEAATKKQYYDAVGVFPPQQRPFRDLIHTVVGIGLASWKKKSEEDHARYRDLQQDLNRKKERYERKRKQFEDQTQQTAAGRASPSPSLSDSMMLSPPASPSPSSSSSSSSSNDLRSIGVGAAAPQPLKNSPEAILARAKADYEQAERAFLEIKAKLQAQHVRKIGGNIVPLEGDQLDRLAYVGTVTDVVPYRNDPHRLTGERRVKASALTDFQDIRIAINTLEWLIAHLITENNIFSAAELVYLRDFEPKVKGSYLSLAAWKEWWLNYGRIVFEAQDKLVAQFPSPYHARGERDRTTEVGQILATIDRDAQGAIVRKILRKIKRLKDEASLLPDDQIDAQFRQLPKETEGLNPLRPMPAIPMIMRYLGADESGETMPVVTTSTKTGNITRTFPNPLPISFVVVSKRQYMYTEGSDDFPHLKTFSLPKNTHGVIEFRAPVYMRAHKESWIKTLRELHERKNTVLAQPLWTPTHLRGQLERYNQLLPLFRDAVEAQTAFLTNLKKRITSWYLPSSYLDIWDFPSSLRFFIVMNSPPALKALEQQSTEMTLHRYGMEDADLLRRRLVNGQWVYVLSPYTTVDSSYNDLQAPKGEAFGDSLTKLILVYNNLRTLETLGSVLGRLVELNVANNRLGDGVSNALLRATSLTSLTLVENGMTNFAPVAQLTNLQHLDISGNVAQNISYLAPLIGLKTLKANHVGLNGKWDMILPHQLPALISLELSDNVLLKLTLDDMQTVHNSLQAADNDTAFQGAYPALTRLKGPKGEWMQGEDQQPVLLSKAFPFSRNSSSIVSLGRSDNGRRGGK